MKLMFVIPILLGAQFQASAGGAREATVNPGYSRSGLPISLTINEGQHYRHRLQISSLISVNNPPQMVVWTETMSGDFLDTLFVTDRIARQGWRGSPGDSTPAGDIRRKEALPVWSYRQGRIYEDGLRLPTRENPVPDGISSATPKRSFVLRTKLPADPQTVVVFFEVNSSTDFNEAYSESAEPGDSSYSGGEWGSGQPSLVYSGVVHLGEAHKRTELRLIGHGSPDGSDGTISGSLIGITTAAEIIDSVEVVIESPQERPET